MRTALFILIALLAAGVQTSPGQQVFGPRLAVKDLRHDLGAVVQGTQASYVFELKNEGTDTLIIQKVQPS